MKMSSPDIIMLTTPLYRIIPRHMDSILEIGSSVISQAQRRSEIVAQNMANVATPGYRRQVSFASFIDPNKVGVIQSVTYVASVDFSAGKLNETGAMYDIAILGDGFFALRREGQVVYTRNGQFLRDADGRLINRAGFALQTAAGADLVLKGRSFVIGADGVVRDDANEVARIAAYDFEDRQQLAIFEAGFVAGDAVVPNLTDKAQFRQGVLETSNVSQGDEMVTLMEALRRAESGQRIIGTYDDLMARVITIFGDSSR